MKKYLFLLLAICMVHQSFAEMVYDVREYVLGTLIQVFDPMTGGEGYNDLETLKRNDRRNNDYVVSDIHDIKNNILDSIRWKQAWKLLTEWSSSIDESIIQQVMMQEIEKFVDNKSFETAMRKTKNHRISLRVAKNILEDLKRKYLAASYLSHGIFRNFIGKKLEQRALERCNRFEEPRQAVHQRHDLYPSEDCCVCYDSFNEVQRVYLMPCGHDICKDCAQQWFFDQKKNSCPKCRASIDKKDLRLALQTNRPPAYNPELFR